MSSVSADEHVDEPMLEVRRLHARRGTREVLAGVSFSARRGEILGIIGPNGAGKTTLFECIAGLLPIASGEVVAREPFFYIPDGIRPWPEQTVRWTIALIARIFATDVVPRLLEELDLTALLDQKVRSLSKGEAKRLGVALGLTAPRPLVLLDEPFDGLDLRQTRKMEELLQRQKANGRTLVLSIHQLTDAARACDRFLLLDHGRSVAEGTLAELLTRTGGSDGSLEDVFLALT